MYQTRKQLKERIRQLEESLENEKSVNVLSNSCGLGKCEGIICTICEHAVFTPSGFNGLKPRLIGCDLTVSCPNYKKAIPTEYPLNLERLRWR